MDLPDVPTGWSVVDGRADALLDASAGRRSVPGLLARREMRLHHVSGLLALAPIVEAVPGLPGAERARRRGPPPARRRPAAAPAAGGAGLGPATLARRRASLSGRTCG